MNDSRVVLITGGSRGIGAACSQKFAQAGDQVAINFRSRVADAEAFMRSLPGDGHLVVQADISSHEACQSLIEQVINVYGRLDVLVNNAGIHDIHPIEETSFDDWVRIWQETMATNLFGPANLMYWASLHMMKRRSGHIINISSRGAFRGEPDQPAYGASKGGLNSLTQSMAKKLGSYGISVTAVAPCFVQTDMVKDLLESPAGELIKKQSPFQRVAKPEDVAEAAFFLASEKAVYASGTIIDVNGASYFR